MVKNQIKKVSLNRSRQTEREKEEKMQFPKKSN